MAETLKPCPFCGSTNLVGSLDAGICMDHEDCDAPDGVVATLYCDECGCQIQAKVPLKDARRADANAKVFEKWNRRAERTCRVECYPPGYEDNLHYEVCSECGTILTASRPGDGHAARASYCPRCGARVVGTDDR